MNGQIINFSLTKALLWMLFLDKVEWNDIKVSMMILKIKVQKSLGFTWWTPSLKKYFE